MNEAWKKKNGIGQPPSLWVDYVELEGPFYDVWPNPVQAELLPPRKQGEDEAGYARRVITAFATRAFRERTPDPEFIDKLVKRYLSKSNGRPAVAKVAKTFGESGRDPKLSASFATGESSEARRLSAAIDTYALILSSPSFIYLSEPTALAAGGTANHTEKPAASAVGSRGGTLTDREFAIRLSYFLWRAPPVCRGRILHGLDELEDGLQLHSQYKS